MGAIFLYQSEEGSFFRKGLEMRLRAVNWKGDFSKWYKKLYTPSPNIGAGSGASAPVVRSVNGSAALSPLERFEKKSALDRFFCWHPGRTPF